MKKNNKFFLLSHGQEISLSSQTSVLKENEIAELINAIELMEEAKKDSNRALADTETECVNMRKKAFDEGYNEGLSQLTQIMKALENEADNIRKQMESIIIKIAIKAAQMIVGKSIEQDPKTISLIISQSLKAVSEHKSVVIYCSPGDYEKINESKPILKQILANANTFSVNPKSDLPSGGYIIQTEKGVINQSDPEKVWKHLEQVFSEQIENKEKE